MFFISYFIDVDTFYLFLNWFSTRVSDDRKYVCGRRLYAFMNTRKFKGIDSREITSLLDIEKVIYMHIFSIIAENYLHTVKVYNARPSQFCLFRFLFFSDHSVVFPCYKVLQSFQAIEFVDRHVSEIFPKISWQNMRGFHPATILSPSFHGVRKERLTQWPTISDPKRQKCPGGGYFQKNWVGMCGTLPETLTLFQTWSKLWYPISVLKPWSPARGKLLRRKH